VDGKGQPRSFRAGIASSSVAFRTNAFDLVAVLGDGSRLLMPYALGAPEGFTPARIDAFDFDGETLTLSQALARATPFIDGDAKPSTLVLPRSERQATTPSVDRSRGASAATTTDGQRQIGGPGDDTLENGATFVFGRGSGHDTVSGWKRRRVDHRRQAQPVDRDGAGVVASDLGFGIEGTTSS
jgi:hypothetical protein